MRVNWYLKRGLCQAAMLIAVASSTTTIAAPVLITNASIVDGTGKPASKGSVRIDNGLIIAVGDLKPKTGEKIIDAGGLTLTPGFIDTHSHHDYELLQNRDAAAAVSQGITTIIAGQDGGHNLPLSKWYAQLSATPTAVNVASYAGHNQIRAEVMGEDFKRKARPDEVSKMSRILGQEMRAGALGLSSGLEYDPGIYSDKSEVLMLAKVTARAGGRYISHMRSEDVALDDAIEELLTIGREAKLPVQISHFKLGIRSKWGKANETLARLDRARAEGIDVTADVYPYEYWQSTLTVLFPKRDFTDLAAAEFALTELSSPEGMLISRYDAEPSLVGKTISQIAAARSNAPAQTYLDLITVAERTKAAEMVIGTSMSSADVADFIAWPHSNISSDGALEDGHPRGAGSFTRVLRIHVRETGKLTLSQAINRMTKNAADHMGISDRGEIAPGKKADLVLFDPTAVRDNATTAQPRALSSGIDKVWVNGTIVFSSGKSTGKYPGEVIRRVNPRKI